MAISDRDAERLDLTSPAAYDIGLGEIIQSLQGGEGSISDGSITTAKFAPDAKAPQASVADAISGPLALNNGVSFGQQVGSSPQDLSKHIDIWGGAWGINVTSGSMNLNTSDSPTNSKFTFYHGTDLIAEIQETVTDVKALTTKQYVDDAVSPKLTATQAAVQADSAAADVAALVTDFNALLAKLEAAGIMAARS